MAYTHSIAYRISKHSQTIFIILFSGFVVSLFVNIRLPLIDDFSFYLREKKDFSIFTLYLSDLFVFSIVLFGLFKLVIKTRPHGYASIISHTYGPLLLLLLTLSAYFLNFPKLLLPIISIYYLLLLTKGIVLHGTLAVYKKSLFNLFSQLFLIFILLESLLAIFQFSFQHDLGLQHIGETELGPYLWGIAKIEALGQVFVRGYGTFPHPNVLAGFLVAGILFAIQGTLEKARKQQGKLFLLGVLITNLSVVALLMTFSRAAWISAAISVALYFVFTWNSKYIYKGYYYLLFVSILGSVVATTSILSPLIQQRGNVFDKAYQERKSYNQAAIEMISAAPIMGLGPGESIMRMEEHLGERVAAWEIQPIHNYYLLLAAEYGIPFLLIFLWYVVSEKTKALKVLVFNNKNLPLLTLFLSIFACLMLMLFDHYFYTIQSAILLFWTLLGLMVQKVTHETEEQIPQVH